jgi:phosphonoacetaldehyde hydrolase
MKAAAPSHRLKAVIFDLAGTCVDYGSCAPAGAFVELFRRRGVSISAEEARGPMGLHKKDHIRELLALPAVKRKWRRVHGRPWTADDLDSMYAEFIPLQTAVLPQFNRLIPGALELVAAMRRDGVRVGVSTGYNRQMMAIVLAGLAEQGFIPQAAVCAEQVPTGRPAPFMLWRCMEALDAYPPAAVAAVGDTLADIAAGLNAGVWSVGVAGTGNMLGLNEEDAGRLPRVELRRRLKSARDKMKAAGAHAVIDSVADFDSARSMIERRLARGKKP